MRSIIVGTVMSSLVGILVSFILGRFEFALGLVIGTIGSIFWIFSLNLDVKNFARSGNINRIRLGYIVRLMIGAGMMALSFAISMEAFFGSCLGLISLKLGSYISFLFSSGRENNGNKAEFIKER